MARALRIFAAAAVLSVGAAACSSSGGGSSTSTSNGGTASTAATPKGSQIKIGEVSAIGAPGFNYPDYDAAAKAAVLGINARGGVNGHPLVLETCNGEANENLESNCARQLISDGVVAMVSDQPGTAATDIYNQAHVAEVGPLEGAKPESNVFMIDGGSVYYFPAAVVMGKSAGLTKVFMPYVDIPQITPIIDAIEMAAAKAGVTIVGKVAVPATASDMTSYAAQAVRSGAQAVVLPVTPPQVAAMIAAVHQLDPAMKFEEAASLTPAQYPGLGSAATDLIMATSVPPPTDTSNPEVVQYLADEKAEAALGNKYAEPANAAMGSEWMWVSVVAVAKVLSGLKTYTPAAVLNAFQHAGDLGLSMLPGWAPSKAGPAISPRAPNGFNFASNVNSGFSQILDPSVSPNPLNIIPYLS